MCHACRAYDCLGCLPRCERCELETRAAYDAHERRLICDDCRAEERTEASAEFAATLAATAARAVPAAERCTDCHRALPLDIRGLCATCAQIENELWRIDPADVVPTCLCNDCGTPTPVASLSATGLCPACHAKDVAADAACVVLLRAALRKPRAKSAGQLRREQRDRDEARIAEQQRAWAASLARTYAETPAGRDRLAGLYAVAVWS